MKYLKFVTVWLICFALSLFFLVETRPDNRVTVGTAIVAFVLAPAFVAVGTVVYAGENLSVLDKCVLGCNK